MKSDSKRSLYIIILVASFGYFVDAFDLIIASLVRTESIVALNLATTPEDIKAIGISFETWQSWGLLLGGVFFGILGDKIGRMKVLYGSIALYSTSTLLNGLLSPSWGDTYFYYCLFRFLSGFGLAAEMGAAVTIVSEEMKKETRGYGSMVIAAVGLLGAVLAAVLSTYTSLKWNTLFIIGGVLGLLLLLLRISSGESNVFKEQEYSDIGKGAFLQLFTSLNRFKRFILCIGIALPTYYVIGLPTKFAPNFGKALQIDNVSLPLVIIAFYISMSLSDVLCNTLSQKFKSRKIMFYIYNTLSLIAILIFTFYPAENAWQYQFIYCPLLGFSIGYWALITTVAAESFGTNLRATVATSVPNFIRATFIPIAALFTVLDSTIGTIYAGGLIGITCSSIALFSTYHLKETFGIDLNYEE